MVNVIYLEDWTFLRDRNRVTQRFTQWILEEKFEELDRYCRKHGLKVEAYVYDQNVIGYLIACSKSYAEEYLNDYELLDPLDYNPENLGAKILYDVTPDYKLRDIFAEILDDRGEKYESDGTYCPVCRGEFKVRYRNSDGDVIYYCPACRHTLVARKGGLG